MPSADFMPYQQDCIATGWGKDASGLNGRKNVILKKISLGIVEFNKCQRDLQSTPLGRRFRLDSTFICAGGKPGVDTCQVSLLLLINKYNHFLEFVFFFKGDGGAPLVCPADQNGSNRYIQNGIVAWGIGCGREIPGVYMNIGKLRRWIDGVVEFIGLSKTSYTI